MSNRGNNSILKRVFLIALCVILILILAATVVFMMLWKDFFGQVDRLDGVVETLPSELEESILNETDPTDPSFTGPELIPDEVTMPTDPVETVPAGPNVINVLLVGQDRESGKWRQRSDSMILCTINKSSKTLTMTSFLRDTWVRIPDRYDERLNVPYVLGGFPLLNETLEYNFGVSADHFVEVDFSGFRDVIDLVGGVDIEFSSAEAGYFAWLKPEWNLVEGHNLLNGEQALAYARLRNIDNDLNRSNRQRKVLVSLINKAKDLEFSQLYNAVKGMLSMITTDLSDVEILGLVAELAPLLPELSIVSQRIPADGAYEFARIDGKSVIYLSPANLQKNIDIIKSTIEQS